MIYVIILVLKIFVFFEHKRRVAYVTDVIHSFIHLYHLL